MTALVLDTDTISLYRKRRLPAAQVRLVNTGLIFVTFVTVGELHKWAFVHRWGATRGGAMDIWLSRTTILPYDPAVARTWGTIAGRAQLRGRRRPDNDTWIAACCIHARLPLLTQNRRDYVDFATHDGLWLLGA